jgi:hypothetical protein
MDEQLKQQIIQQIGPDVINKMVGQMLQKMQGKNVTAEQLQPVIDALTMVMQQPDLYPQMVQKLTQIGVVRPGVLPEEFEPTIVAFLLLLLTEVAKVLDQRNTAMPVQFARGGLAQVARQLQSKGRHGDTMLAHINPQEAAMLKAMGGSGTTNPHTGLPEFGFFDDVFGGIGDALSGIGDAIGDVFEGAVDVVKDVVGALGPVAPILVGVMAPWAIPALAGSMGIGTLAAGALYGAGTSALMGQDPIKGALMGGLGGGLGELVGGAANSFLGTDLGTTGQALLGNTLVGGAAGALTGQGFGKGAMNAAIGTMAGNTIGNLAGSGAGTPLGAGLTQAGKTIGQLSTAGVPLKEAVLGGALSGLASGLMTKTASPLDTANDVSADIDSQIDRVNKLLEDPNVPDTAKEAYRNYANQLQTSKQTMAGYKDTLSQPEWYAPDQIEYKRVEDLMKKPGFGAYSDTRGIYEELGIAPPASAQIGATNVGFNKPTMMAAATALSPMLLSGIAQAQTPQQVQGAIQNSNPEYFNNLRLTSWDWDAISKKAEQAGLPLGTYVANNWNTLTQESAYTSPGQTVTPPSPMAPKPMARGGALSKVAYLARGAGTGRADTIDARLSDGEYVIDAETVAMLGDGSTQAGASKLDQMRSQIRKHKGRALAKGKISPDAKSPLAYIKGAM